MRRPLVPALGACLLAASWAAPADDLYSGASTFLDFGRFHTPFRYSDGDHQAYVGRYGVAYREPLGGDLGVGLHGGYATLDVAGEPQPVPGSFDGRYLGLDLSYEGSGGDYLDWSGAFSYTWHDVEGHGPGAPSSDIGWYESWLAAGPVLRYRGLRLSLGAYYQYLDGRETDAQPSRELDFRSSRGPGAYLGLALALGNDQSLGLYVTGGARQGVRLVLRRDF